MNPYGVLNTSYSAATARFGSVAERLFYYVICLTLLTCRISLGQTASGRKLTLRSGAVIEYWEARVEGSDVILKLPYGSMRVQTSTVSEESLQSISGHPSPPP